MRISDRGTPCRLSPARLSFQPRTRVGRRSRSILVGISGKEEKQSVRMAMRLAPATRFCPAVTRKNHARQRASNTPNPARDGAFGLLSGHAAETPRPGCYYGLICCNEFQAPRAKAGPVPFFPGRKCSAWPMARPPASSAASLPGSWRMCRTHCCESSSTLHRSY